MTDISLYLLIAALTTYLIRAVPLITLRREIKNIYVRRFLYYVPFACLTAMTIPGIFFSTGSVISAVVGFVVALILGLFKRSLPTVAAAACAAVFFTELIMSQSL